MPLPDDPKARKQIPLYRLFTGYFPDAIAALAHLCYVANEQHNPGEPVHWDREKSSDHEDCILRHLLDRHQKGLLDKDGQLHSVKMAWRALAIAQIEIEEYFEGQLAQTLPRVGDAG